MTKVIAPVNPSTLSQARIAAGYHSIEVAVENMSFIKADEYGAEKMRGWETGEIKMSLPQAKNFAKACNVPYTHLYMMPELFQKMVPDIHGLVDFRREEDRRLTPNMIRFLREVMMRQHWLREIKPVENKSVENKPSLKENDYTPRSATKISEWYREVLFHDSSTLTNHLMDWINKIEIVMSVNVMQSRQSHFVYKVESELSGAAFCDTHVPVIALNSSDKQERRLFTLIHELAHITHAGGGISKADYRLFDGQRDNREEWCNQVAAETLMPESIYTPHWHEVKSTKDPLLKYKKIGKLFGVSISATIVRASKLELIKYPEAKGLLQMINKQRNNSVKKDKDKQKIFGGMPQNLIARDRAGPAMTKLALQSYDEGQLSARDLNNIFGVKLSHLPKIAERVGYQLVRWHGGEV